jgi:glycosyltransferase involved in cell wall biosynthesis
LDIKNKKKIAIVRGPNLNSWEMQNYAPLLDTFDITGFTSYGHNYDVREIPFKVKKLLSIGQIFHPRIIRKIINNVIGDYHDLQGLSRELRNYHIVHCVETSYYCTYQVAKIKKINKFKLVVTVWENIPFLYSLPATERRKKVVFAETDLFLPTSERAKQVLLLEGVPEEKISVQMPGVDTEHFKPMEKDYEMLRRYGCTKNDFIILYVANLYREKGIYDLIFAFRALLNHFSRRSDLKLLIAGRGREEARIRSLIKKLKLSDYVRLIGSHSYAIMPKIHNLADVFVLPSIPIENWQEQFGYVLIESMACGKPVISTFCGSIPEVVGDAGIIVQPNDFMSLKDAISSVILDDSMRNILIKSSKNRVNENFSLNVIVKIINNIYQDLIGNDKI